MWTPFLHSFPGNEAHYLFLGRGGGHNGVFWGGRQKVLVDIVNVLFCPLKEEMPLNPARTHVIRVAGGGCAIVNDSAGAVLFRCAVTLVPLPKASREVLKNSRGEKVP